MCQRCAVRRQGTMATTHQTLAVTALRGCDHNDNLPLAPLEPPRPPEYPLPPLRPRWTISFQADCNRGCREVDGCVMPVSVRAHACVMPSVLSGKGRRATTLHGGRIHQPSTHIAIPAACRCSDVIFVDKQGKLVTLIVWNVTNEVDAGNRVAVGTTRRRTAFVRGRVSVMVQNVQGACSLEPVCSVAKHVLSTPVRMLARTLYMQLHTLPHSLVRVAWCLTVETSCPDCTVSTKLQCKRINVFSWYKVVSAVGLGAPWLLWVRCFQFLPCSRHMHQPHEHPGASQVPVLMSSPGRTHRHPRLRPPSG